LIDALQETRQWLERAVIGLNLCPFAKAVHTRGQIRWVLSTATEPRELLADLERELQFLAAADPLAVDTTLLVHPQVLADFEDYNDFLGAADAALEDLALDGTLQIASFHPDYRFEDADEHDMANATNRSPHPMLHLLREASIDRAVQAYPDAEAIYERNIETLRRLGAQGWQQVLQAAVPPDP